MAQHGSKTKSLSRSVYLQISVNWWCFLPLQPNGKKRKTKPRYVVQIKVPIPRMARITRKQLKLALFYWQGKAFSLVLPRKNWSIFPAVPNGTCSCRRQSWHFRKTRILVSCIFMPARLPFPFRCHSIPSHPIPGSYNHKSCLAHRVYKWLMDHRSTSTPFCENWNNFDSIFRCLLRCPSKTSAV